MPLDKTAYQNLEQRFRDQVIRDRAQAIERVVQGWGVYLPCVEPTNQVDYIIVGMEPSFGWADSVEDGERKVVEGGATNFGAFTPPDDSENPLDLLKLSIKRFLCQPGETYHLTDVSKGAMPVTVAALDRDRRYKEWYPLLLDEIAIVGKPSGPVVAIGKEVERFLQRMDLKGETRRPLYAVLHYSYQASSHWKTEAERDPEGFEAFEKDEFCERKRWAKDLSTSKKQLVFTYKKQFEAIRAACAQTEIPTR